MKKLLVVLLLIGLGAGGYYYYANHVRAEQAPNFRIAEVERGDLLITISANGTLEPEELVDVGAQVMGRIEEFGMDPRAATDPAFKDKRIDYRTDVEEGTVLARIDNSLYLAARNEAKAAVDRADADLVQLEAKLALTDAEFKRAERLRNVKLTSLSGGGSSPGNGQPPTPTTIKGISDADYILAKANFEVAEANLKVGKAAVEQQRAMLASAEKNLEYTVIKSPVKGTIIDRRVNVGQTVVSSLNAPSLFLIAKDLRRLEVWTNVNEADIGQLKVGMPVHFSVDAFPGEKFIGQVSKIRLNAQMTSQVVIYIVEVTTNNDDLKLLPYLSADVKFEVDHRKDVLLVPNSALRYRPRPELIAAQPADASVPAATTKPASSADDGATDRRTVWVKDGNKVRPVEVEVVVTDGTLSEIAGGGLEEGTEIVESEDLPQATPSEGTNPFMPMRPKAKSKAKKAA